MSDDGGRTFDPIEAPVPRFYSMGVDPDGTIWILGWDGETSTAPRQFHSSPDGGATWRTGVSLTGLYGTFAVGGTVVYAGGSRELLAAARDGSSGAKVVASLPPLPMYFNHVVVADRKDNVVVLSVVDGQVEARRLASGDSAFSPTKTLGPSYYPPGAVALSNWAVAVMLTAGRDGVPGPVSVVVEVWP